MYKKDLFAVLTALYQFNQKTCAQGFWANGWTAKKLWHYVEFCPIFTLL